MTHVLAVRSDNDGDVLLAGPALRALAHGADRLTLLCGPRGRHAAEALPGVDELLVWRADWIDAAPRTLDRAHADTLLDALRDSGVDRAVIFSSFHQSPLPMALLLRLAGVPWIGAISIDYPGTLLDLRHGVHDDVHEVERGLSLARAAGGQLPEDDTGELRVRRLPPGSVPRPFESNYVVVHPGASVPARAWPADAHAALVDTLVDAGRQVVVTGGPGELELTRAVSGAPRADVVDLGGQTSFRALGEVIAGADCIVVGNTGPAHLAAAVGTPVVSLFAPTVPAVRWRPWRVGHELHYAAVPCAGCRARACPVAGHPCMAGVGVAEVATAVARLAGARQTDAAPAVTSVAAAPDAAAVSLSVAAGATA